MSTDTSASVIDENDVVAIGRRWVKEFTALLEHRDPAVVDDLFAPQATWRDLLALSWDLRSAVGIDAVREFVSSGIADVGLRAIRIRDDQEPSLVDAGPMGTFIQIPLTIETEHGFGCGLVRLIQEERGWSAGAVVTELDSLKGVARHHTEWSDISDDRWTKAKPAQPNWSDNRDPGRPFPSQEPTVLVVGAGQCGLALAARLEHLDVDTIVVERNPRVGDSWRKRHYNLITHTPSFTDHLPYLPFPDNWPISAPKDKLASWIEHYADALDLPVWTSTEVTGGSYDEAAGHWTVEVRRSSGETEILRPQHLVLATGLLSIPSIPALKGREEFGGPILHSSEYRSAADYRGKRVVVVGSGASGHDIVQDLYEQGVEDVTMVQRSETYVMSFEHGIYANYGLFYSHESARDLDTTDLAFNLFPLPVAIEASKVTTPVIAEQDKELLEGLSSAGFKLNHDGMLANGLQSGVGGYYIDQGCSQLIIDGKVKLKRGEVVGFDEHRVLFADGSSLDADVVVLCTGYKNMRESARLILGEEAYRRCKETWVLDYSRGGEHSALWTDSGHPHLWFMAGSLHHARLHSKHLALRLKAEISGIVPQAVPGAS